LSAHSSYIALPKLQLLAFIFRKYPVLSLEEVSFNFLLILNYKVLAIYFELIELFFAFDE
jgi:hypothetical protein